MFYQPFDRSKGLWIINEVLKVEWYRLTTYAQTILIRTCKYLVIWLIRDTKLFISMDICSDGLNHLRNSDLVVKKIYSNSLAKCRL